MARKIERFTAQDGRDKGKVFQLTEMPCSQAEKWAARAFFAIAQAGAEVPDNLRDMGFAGLMQLGVTALAKAPYAQVEPLLDEMMGCVQMMPSPNKPEIIRPLVEDDIEEIATRLKIRAQLLRLHSGFSTADA